MKAVIVFALIFVVGGYALARSSGYVVLMGGAQEGDGQRLSCRYLSHRGMITVTMPYDVRGNRGRDRCPLLFGPLAL